MQNDSREGEVTRYRRGHFLASGNPWNQLLPTATNRFSVSHLWFEEVSVAEPWWNVWHPMFHTMFTMKMICRFCTKRWLGRSGRSGLFSDHWFCTPGFTSLLMGWQVWLFLALVIAPHHTTLWVSDSAVETCRKYQPATDEQNRMTKCAECAVGDMLQK